VEYEAVRTKEDLKKSSFQLEKLILASNYCKSLLSLILEIYFSHYKVNTNLLKKLEGDNLTLFDLVSKNVNQDKVNLPIPDLHSLSSVENFDENVDLKLFHANVSLFLEATSSILKVKDHGEKARRNYKYFEDVLDASFLKLGHSKSSSKVSQSIHDSFWKTELDSMIGLINVKNEINSIYNYVKISQLRESSGLNVNSSSYHSVFIGSPGTGKTSVARFYGSMLKELGILEKGHLVEVDRSGLVAGYVGQTAIKTSDVINEAIGGVLFIDEAYALYEGDNPDNFGTEAIQVLLKRMEDDRHEFVVIVAGYSDKMEDFLNSNPGLASRFNRTIEFQNYSSLELYEIFLALMLREDYSINDEQVKKPLLDFFDKSRDGTKDTFGNARFVRNFFENVKLVHANRIMNLPGEKSKLVLASIEREDILTAIDRII